MTDLDELPFAAPDSQPNLGAAPPRKHRHDFRSGWVSADGRSWATFRANFYDVQQTRCSRCGAIRNEANARRGRQSRNYGNRAELDVARRYGGTKVGHAGGPVDVRGAEFATQVKTHRRLPPLEWTKAFAAMSASAGVPRLLLRFVATGQPPDDYFVIPAKAWLEWFGKDEEAPR
jgi:hypothetical protein